MTGIVFQPLMASLPKQAIATPISLGTGQAAASSTSVSLTTAANITGGSLVVVGIIVGFAAAQTITSVSDGTNTYTQAATAVWDATGSFVCDLWYKQNAVAVASGATLTANFSAASISSNNVPIICAGLVTGTLGTSSLDKTNSGKQEPGTAYASGSTGTLSQANEIAIGFVGGFGNVTSITEGSGFTQINQRLQGSVNNWAGNLAYQKVAATTALNYQPTLSNSFGAAIIATFKGY